MKTYLQNLCSPGTLFKEEIRKIASTLSMNRKGFHMGVHPNRNLIVVRFESGGEKHRYSLHLITGACCRGGGQVGFEEEYVLASFDAMLEEMKGRITPHLFLMEVDTARLFNSQALSAMVEMASVNQYKDVILEVAPEDEGLELYMSKASEGEGNPFALYISGGKVLLETSLGVQDSYPLHKFFEVLKRVCVR